jgi:hypothetical protein
MHQARFDPPFEDAAVTQASNSDYYAGAMTPQGVQNRCLRLVIG